MTLLTSNPIVVHEVIVTQEQINSPTTEMLADYAAIYTTGVKPIVRYHSNGTGLEIVTQSQETIELLITQSDNISGIYSQVEAIARAEADEVRIELSTRPSVNITMADGRDLQTYLDNLETRIVVNPAAPTNSSQPAAPSGTLGVGDTLTASTANWTGATTYEHTWLRINATTGVMSPIGRVADTYIIQAQDVGYYIATSSVGISNAVPPLRSSPYISVYTAVITADATPTNSVAPSLSPSGNQTYSTELTWNVGTWANAAGGYVVRISYDGALRTTTTRSTSTTGVFTSNVGDVGKVVSISVTGYSTGLVASTPVAGSNTATMTGDAPVFTQITPPALPALYDKTTILVTPGVYSQTPTSATYEYFKVVDGDDIHIRGPNSFLQFQPNNPQYNDGLVAGVDSVVVYEVPTWNGIPRGPFRSNVRLVNAVAAAFAIQPSSQSQSGYSWLAGSPIQQATLGTMTGGTKPYVLVSITPNLPAGLTASLSGTNNENVVVNGTPAQTASTTYTVNVRDSA